MKTARERAERRARGLYWDKRWQLVDGCTPVSPGCDNCWSQTESHMRQFNPCVSQRFKGVMTAADEGGSKFSGMLSLHVDRFEIPLRAKQPSVYAVWNDLFHASVPVEFIDRAYAVMALCPQHTFLVLTKRPERMAEYFSRDYCDGKKRTIKFLLHEWAQACLSLGWTWEDPDTTWDSIAFGDYPLTNVYHGTTVENQELADRRIPHLLQVPGKRFLSIEPMLGAIDLSEHLEKPDNGEPYPEIHQILLGGESGKDARPMHPDWARSVRDQCQAAGVPFMFKQWGEWAPDSLPAGAVAAGVPGYVFDEAASVLRVGKKKAGRHLDGELHDDLVWEGEA